MRRYAYGAVLALAVVVVVLVLIGYTATSKDSGGRPRPDITDVQRGTSDNGPPSMIATGAPSP